MTKAQIFKKALEKAIGNATEEFLAKNVEGWRNLAKMGDEALKSAIEDGEHLKIIFQQDFAWAFWGNEMGCLYCGKGECTSCPFRDDNNAVAEFPEYEYHLREMVLESDPLQYLAEWLS